MKLEVRDPNPGLVERADDVGELLAAVRVEPDRGTLRGPGHQLTERAKQLHGAVPFGVIGRDHLDSRATDLGLQLLRGTRGHDLAVVDDPEVVGELVGLLEVLGGEEDGHSLVAGEMSDLVPERAAALDVEAGGRLVEEEDARTVEERQGEVEPAFHATGVAAHLAIGGVGEPDALDQLIAAPGAVSLGHAVEGALQPHVVARGEVRVEDVPRQTHLSHCSPSESASRDCEVSGLSARDRSSGCRIRDRAAPSLR